MGRKSRYMIRFELLEDEMLEAGTNIADLKAYIEVPLKNQGAFIPTVLYHRRYERLRDILNALDEIKNEVNEKTRNLIDLLYFECMSFDQVARTLEMTEKRIVSQHILIVDEMMDLLGYSVSEKSKYKRTDRVIPSKVKREVFERDEGKCIKCDSEENLHYHHKIRFSKGGQHTAENLDLLCRDCHAKEHKDETAYSLLKPKL